MNNELIHYGVLGMKWGIRRYQKPDGSLTGAGKSRYSKDSTQYKSTGVKSAIARRANEKIDKGFRKWDENTKKKENAIELGKQANISKLAYEKDKSNKDLKTEYKQSQKEYQKALKKNTTYRKGVIKQEVGRDQSKKYLSEAKQIQKDLLKDPKNKQLQKKYNDLMSNYNVERAQARRAASVGRNRSSKIASLKRAKTIAVRAAITGTAITVGTVAINTYLQKKGQTGIASNAFKNAVEAGKKLFGFADDYVY